MLIGIVALLCLTALANLLLVINFFPVPSWPSNIETSIHLSYSGPLASWHCYSFILSYLCLWLSVWCFETGAHSQRAAACQEDTWPRARFSPICHQLMAPLGWVSQQPGHIFPADSVLSFPTPQPSPLQPAWPPGSPHPDLGKCSGEHLGPSQQGHCYVLMCCVRSDRSFCSFIWT